MENRKKYTFLGLNILFLIIFEYLILILVSVLMKIAELKLNLTSDILYQEMSRAAMHPILTSRNFINQANPLYILSAVSTLVYILYLSIKQIGKNNKSWEISNKGTHGTAKWGTLKDLSDGNYKVIKKNDFFEQWLNTLED